MKKTLIFIFFLIFSLTGYGQNNNQFKKRVLESTEVDFLSSYYVQNGDSAATSGGQGNEFVDDITGTIIISIPLNDDDVLKIDAGISAYTSASSSNINPFSSKASGEYIEADPYNATTGASAKDVWSNFTLSYSHSSDDRNNIYNTKVSISNEYDYSSFGFGGGFTKLLNEKNTEFSLNTNIYLDEWKLLTPIELGNNDDDDDKNKDDDEDEEDFNLDDFDITDAEGNFTTYNPNKFFTPITNKKRSSYSLSVGLSQILSKKAQTLFSLDIILQEGLLSTPFHRIYFKDISDAFIDNFQLANDIERLPNSRTKMALGNRSSFYINEFLVLKSYYRYYSDDWGINSHTASIELPIKITSRFTLYPSYRYYNQTAADYFASYNQHLSTTEFYTSDNDLSAFNAHQFAFGVSYTDIFTNLKILGFGLKTVDLKFAEYNRNSTFNARIITLGVKFIAE